MKRLKLSELSDLISDLHVCELHDVSDAIIADVQRDAVRIVQSELPPSVAQSKAGQRAQDQWAREESYSSYSDYLEKSKNLT